MWDTIQSLCSLIESGDQSTSSSKPESQDEDPQQVIERSELWHVGHRNIIASILLAKGLVHSSQKLAEALFILGSFCLVLGKAVQNSLQFSLWTVINFVLVQVKCSSKTIANNCYLNSCRQCPCINQTRTAGSLCKLLACPLILMLWLLWNCCSIKPVSARFDIAH